jgi:hypothetical protein
MVRGRGGEYMKTFLTYAGTQFLAYSILIFNIRMVAQHKVMLALMTNALYATILFCVIHKISHDKSGIAPWAGFVVGSVMGTWLGMSI